MSSSTRRCPDTRAQEIHDFWDANSFESPGNRAAHGWVDYFDLRTCTTVRMRWKLYERADWELYDVFRRRLLLAQPPRQTARAEIAAPTSVAELVERLQARSRFSHSEKRDRERPLEGMTFTQVPEEVVAAQVRGAQTVDGSNSFFSARFDASSETPVMYSAERSCRCVSCASLLFDSCTFAASRPTAWTKHVIKVKPPAAVVAAAAEDADGSDAEEVAVPGSVVAIAAPNDPDTPFYLIQVIEQLKVPKAMTNSALLDADEKPMKFYKGDTVLRGYWWNRVSTADTAHLPADERFQFLELWDTEWRDTGTWEAGSVVLDWLKRSKRSVEVVVRVSAVELWDVEVEDALPAAVARHRALGHVGRIGVLSAHTLDRLAAAFSDSDD